jgi:haloacid dehalogenase-like hydrolase
MFPFFFILDLYSISFFYTHVFFLRQDLLLYGILGIKDPLRAGVIDAVSIANRAGVRVRMVTGDNKITASAIARECGILSRSDDIVMEGPVFRTLTPAQLDQVLPRLAVLARSSPKDKMILVRRLNGNLPHNEEKWKLDHPDSDWNTDRDRLLPGYYDEWKVSRKHVSGVVSRSVVGVTGDGTNDAPALHASDVGYVSLWNMYLYICIHIYIFYFLSFLLQSRDGYCWNRSCKGIC